MTRRLRMSFALALALLAPSIAHASGAWSTYLRMNTCNAVLALRDTVWFATGEAGLVRYVRSTDTFGSITREPGGLASNALTALAYDRSGRLWVGTPGKGVSRLSADGAAWDLFNAFDGLPSDSVTSLTSDGDTVFVGTTRGLTLWDGAQASSIPDLGTPSPFRSDFVTGVAVVHDSVFVATTDGMYVALFSQQLATWANIDAGLTNTNIVTLATDGHEVFALSSGNTNRWSMTSKTWGVAAGQGPVKNLRGQFGLLLCTTPTGLWYWHTNRWDPLPGSPVTDGTTDGGVECGSDPARVAIATKGGKIMLQGASSFTTLVPPGPVGNNVQNMVVDGSRLWMNTFSEGIARYDGSAWLNYPADVSRPANQDTAFLYSAFAFTLQKDVLGRKWFSTWDAAIERVDDSGPRPVITHVVVSPGSNNPLSLHTLGWSSTIDDQGYLYIGGDTPDRGGREPIGIDVYDMDGNRVANWNSSNDSLADNQVRALAYSPRSGVLWAGFPGGGVSYIELANVSRPGSLPRVTKVNLGSNAISDIFGIVAHGDSIWALSTGGLLRIRGASHSLVSQSAIPAAPAPRGAVHPLEVSPDGSVWVASVNGVRHYKVGGGAEDFTAANSPLADDEVRAVVADPVTGVVWFGTASGLNRYDPHYTPPAPPKLSGLSLNLYPNPVSLTAMGMDLRLKGNGTSYAGEVLDIRGRIVRRFTVAANDRAFWDGRDGDGRLVDPGIYFVRARSGGREATSRIAVLR